MPSLKNQKIIFIVGPTAVGKSEAALALAERVNGEIISCDAMQVYKEVSIASDKPSLKILKKVPHHLINLISVEESFDVARFRTLAVAAIEGIHKRGKVPIIVGGSGMYMTILLDGIFEQKAKDDSLRDAIKKEAEEKGVGVLYERLKECDPQAAAKVHPNDLRRIARALEVYQLKEKPISVLQKDRKGLWGTYDIVVFAFNRDRKELYQRIEERIDGMFDRGLIKEVQKLSSLKLGKTAQSLIGIPEVTGYLNGEYDLKQAQYLMKLHTRHFAKRQLTWFRRDKRLNWIMLDAATTTKDLVDQLMKEMERNSSYEKNAGS